ncbi:MAG TPA: hypothetical protein ENI34_06055 [candidate division WOR-3 bacterium]|uniref:Uncharacterized protein n=1 Tax=candidate division WOR-3 bacterium TaxID=2052148 RepID=A0A9C9EMA3_UNCW3|nr:hypothetical protein [candidate division WOR-3 bacterium]
MQLLRELNCYIKNSHSNVVLNIKSAAVLCIIISLSFISCATPIALKPKTPYAAQYLKKAKRHPTEYMIPRSKDYLVWGRAQSFVAKYGDMKLQIISDFVIDTYNPTMGNLGFRIIKTPVGDSLQITVQCVAGGTELMPVAVDYSHLCAYYLRSGIEPPFDEYEKIECRPSPFPALAILSGIGIIVYLLIAASIY